MGLRRNVLIFHQAALGDFVLTWPLALAAGRLYAQSRIIYVTSSQKGALAERALRVESADVEHGWHLLHGQSPCLPPAAQKLLDGAHSLIHYAARPDERWSANARQLAPHAEQIWLSPNPPEGSGIHATEHVLQQLASHRLLGPALQQMLRSIRARGIGISRAAGAYILLHPGAGSAKKCWPRERFAALARALRSRGLAMRAVLGEVELEQWSRADIDALRDAAEVVMPRTPLELLDQLLGAQLVIGNDSGPAHLAGICAVPTVVLFGASDPSRWSPIGPHVRVIQADSMGAINVETVLAACLLVGGWPERTNS